MAKIEVQQDRVIALLRQRLNDSQMENVMLQAVIQQLSEEAEALRKTLITTVETEEKLVEEKEKKA